MRPAHAAGAHFAFFFEYRRSSPPATPMLAVAALKLVTRPGVDLPNPSPLRDLSHIFR
jgi:hypothetical protein